MKGERERILDKNKSKVYLLERVCLDDVTLFSGNLLVLNPSKSISAAHSMWMKSLPLAIKNQFFVNGNSKTGSEYTYQYILQTGNYQRSNIWKMETDPLVLKTQNRPQKPQLEIKPPTCLCIKSQMDKKRQPSFWPGVESVSSRCSLLLQKSVTPTFPI